MSQCPYRKSERECSLFESNRNTAYCDRCLKGQIADEISLNTSAIMNLSMNKMEDEAINKKKCVACGKVIDLQKKQEIFIDKEGFIYCNKPTCKELFEEMISGG